MQAGASTVVSSLASANVVVFTTPACPYCRCAPPRHSLCKAMLAS